jgi:hypothetical protein
MAKADRIKVREGIYKVGDRYEWKYGKHHRGAVDAIDEALDARAKARLADPTLPPSAAGSATSPAPGGLVDAKFGSQVRLQLGPLGGSPRHWQVLDAPRGGPRIP